MSAQPSISKWDLALDGIAELGKKIDGLGERLESRTAELTRRDDDLQGQLIDLRTSYTRTAPMAMLMSLEGRVGALETGATAKILAHMEREEQQRVERQLEVDRQREQDRAERAAFEARAARRNRLLVIALAVVVLALLLVAGVTIWAELYG